MSQGVFLVTGGTRGIGAATARLAAERGYKVAVFYRSDHDAANRLAGAARALAARAARSSTSPPARRAAARPALGSTTRRAKARSTVSPSASPRKSRVKASA